MKKDLAIVMFWLAIVALLVAMALIVGVKLTMQGFMVVAYSVMAYAAWQGAKGALGAWR